MMQSPVQATHANIEKMKINILLILIICYLTTSSFTHFQLIPDHFDPEVRRNNILILAREISIILITFVILIALLMKNNQKNLYLLILFMLFSLISVYFSVYDDESMSEIIVGIRVTILILITLLTPYGVSLIDKHTSYIFYTVAVLLLVQIMIIPFQVSQMPAFYGATFFGSRPVGTFASPLHLSLFCGAASVLFVTKKYKYWKLLTICALMISLSSGGRSGIIVVTISIFSIFFDKIKMDFNGKLFISIIIPISLMVIYIFSSDPIISGRDGTAGGFREEARWLTWAVVLERSFYSASVSDWLFGIDIGVGSNTAASVSDGPRNISDSTFIFFLQSYGLLGTCLILFTTIIFWRVNAKLAKLAIAAWFICASTQVMMEIHPANLIFLSSIAGSAAGLRRPSRAESNQSAPYPQLSK